MTSVNAVAIADGSLLSVACGLEAVALRLDVLVDRYVPGSPDPAPIHEPTVDLVLGLISLRRHLATTIERARCAPRSSPEPSTAQDSLFR